MDWLPHQSSLEEWTACFASSYFAFWNQPSFDPIKSIIFWPLARNNLSLPVYISNWWWWWWWWWWCYIVVLLCITKNVVLCAIPTCSNCREPFPFSFMHYFVPNFGFGISILEPIVREKWWFLSFLILWLLNFQITSWKTQESY